MSEPASAHGVRRSRLRVRYGSSDTDGSIISAYIEVAVNGFRERRGRIPARHWYGDVDRARSRRRYRCRDERVGYRYCARNRLRCEHRSWLASKTAVVVRSSFSTFSSASSGFADRNEGSGRAVQNLRIQHATLEGASALRVESAERRARMRHEYRSDFSNRGPTSPTREERYESALR